MNEPGIHDGVTSQAYHRDERPLLQSGIAHTMVTRSPHHAWTAHPALNPEWEPIAESKFDLGSCVHSLFLEGEDNAYVVREDSWRTRTAQEARAEARLDGRIPLLQKDYERALAMLEALRSQLDEFDVEPPLFYAGAPERVLVWSEGDVLCKARCDWLSDDYTVIEDLKTRGQDGGAAIDKWERALYIQGAHLQAAMYRRGVEVLTGVTPTFRWVCVETHPPYELTITTPGKDVLAIGLSDFQYALARWRECLATDTWPGYPRELVRLEAPPWEIEKRVAREEALA